MKQITRAKRVMIRTLETFIELEQAKDKNGNMDIAYAHGWISGLKQAIAVIEATPD